MGSRALFSRRVVYINVAAINSDNIINVLQKALFTHPVNQADTGHLYRYYKGDQPVPYRKKEVRLGINNKVAENRANEIVSFKVGYLVGEPIQYVSRGDDEKAAEKITQFDDCVLSEDKAAKDKELTD